MFKAAAIESAEAHAWADLYAAAPPDHARRLGLRAVEVQGALMIQATGGGYGHGLFNRPIGLGVIRPATRPAVQRIVRDYRDAGAPFMIHSQPHCRPIRFEEWLADEGLRPAGAWDRIVRGPIQPTEATSAGERRIAVETVDETTAGEWSAFLCEVYGVDGEPWLRALARRERWRHYLAREDGRPIAARSMYLDPAGIAFLGIDGPVPGVMTTDYEPDERLCETIVRDGLDAGANRFIADVESPSPAMDTPAYDAFRRLGFRRAYTRVHHA
jgi:hypothetical protein